MRSNSTPFPLSALFMRQGLTLQPRQDLKSQKSFCCSLLSARIAGGCAHGQSHQLMPTNFSQLLRPASSFGPFCTHLPQVASDLPRNPGGSTVKAEEQFSQHPPLMLARLQSSVISSEMAVSPTENTSRPKGLCACSPSPFGVATKQGPNASHIRNRHDSPLTRQNPRSFG